MRHILTAEEHERLVTVGETFSRDLAAAAAKALVQFRPEVRDEVTMYLQDCTSLYSPLTADRIQTGIDSGFGALFDGPPPGPERGR